MAPLVALHSSIMYGGGALEDEASLIPANGKMMPWPHAYMQTPERKQLLGVVSEQVGRVCYDWRCMQKPGGAAASSFTLIHMGDANYTCGGFPLIC